MLPTTTLPDSFGDALRFLRKRARLTQEELGRAVGYSREQIARLEKGSRLPDLAVIAALFVPALLLERERPLVERFLALAGQTRSEVQVTVTHKKETRIRVVRETETGQPPRYRLPAPLLPLVGRSTEVDELGSLLRSARLVTLIGAPGIGKTRLALEVAHAVRPAFSDGAVFVSLAEAQSAGDIPYAVLRALDITPAAGQTPAAAVRAELAPRTLLLVMDNCEHLVEGAAMLAEWLADAPGLKLLCTSRVPLDLYGEQEWPLAPLAVPDLATPPDRERWGQLPALQLLLARARAADPAFALTEENLLPLASLCVALDGLPLALELAAVRLRDNAPADLIRQLMAMRGHTHLSSTWLAQTRRNVAERHRTLQAAIGWSAQLLSPAARDAFLLLGVFAGGSTQRASLDVAGADAATLAQLARANLIRLQDGRVLLLETIRSFAAEQLAAAGDLPAARRAHAHHYAAYAQQIFDGLIGDDQAAWMARAIADHDNCLGALRWALAEEDGETAVAIAGNLWWFWYRRGFYALGREMLAAALALPSTALAVRANALNGLASFCLEEEDYTANLSYHEQGLALQRQLNNASGIATVLHNMGLTAFVMGDFANAARLLEESIAVYPEGDPTLAYAHLGLLAQETLDLPAALRWLELAYAGAEASSADWMRAFVMNYLADVRRDLGQHEAAARLAQESLRLFADLGDTHYLPDAQLTLAQVALQRGDYDEAAALAVLAREQYETRGDGALVASALLVEAELAAAQGRRDEVAELLERARVWRGAVTRSISPRERAQVATLAPAEVAAAWPQAVPRSDS